VDACFTGFPTTLGSGQAEPLPSNLLLDDKHLQAVSITDLDIRTAPLFPNQSRSALWNRKVQPVAADVLEELRVSVQTHGCIVLTASRSHQASVEVIFNNEVRGAFTVFLLEAFKAGAVDVLASLHAAMPFMLLP